MRPDIPEKKKQRRINKEKEDGRLVFEFLATMIYSCRVCMSEDAAGRQLELPACRFHNPGQRIRLPGDPIWLSAASSGGHPEGAHFGRGRSLFIITCKVLLNKIYQTIDYSVFGIARFQAISQDLEGVSSIG